MVLKLGRVHAVLRIEGWVLVEIRHQDGLTVAGLDMFTRTAVAMPAGTDLVVETTVDLVLLCAEDGGEEVRHDVVLRRWG